MACYDIILHFSHTFVVTLSYVYLICCDVEIVLAHFSFLLSLHVIFPIQTLVSLFSSLGKTSSAFLSHAFNGASVKPETLKEKKNKSTIVKLKQTVFWGTPGNGQGFERTAILTSLGAFIDDIRCTHRQESQLLYIVRKDNEREVNKGKDIHHMNGVTSQV